MRIVHLDACYEFPFDTTRALELAFPRTFAVPSIAQLLASTGEFTDRALKRYDDTDLLISTFAENGYDSAIGRAAIRRMNQIHGRFLKEGVTVQTPVKRGSPASHRSERLVRSGAVYMDNTISEGTAYLQRLLDAL